METQSVFLANRTDGLGQRLKSIVHAFALAEHFGGRVAISWRERSGRSKLHHAVTSADDTFAAAFIERYFVAEDAFPDAVPFASFLRDAAAAPAGGAVLAPHDFPPASRAEMDRRLPPAARAAAFARLTFAPDVAAAIATADRLALPPEAAAVHLRAGDVVYGPFRCMDSFTDKVIPFQIALDLIRQRMRACGAVVLFGQDAPLCRAIAAATGALLAEDLLPPAHRKDPARALFEIALMSRCAEIHAGASGFPELAALRSGTPIRSFDAGLTLARATDLVLNRPPAAPRAVPNAAAEVAAEADTQTAASSAAQADVEAAASDLQKAFSFWWLADRLLKAPETDLDTVLYCLQRARQHDPENGFYNLVEARLLWDLGRPAEAEAVLASAAAAGGGAPLLALLGDPNRPLRSQRPAFQAAAEAGSPWAAACLALDNAPELDPARAALARQARDGGAALPALWTAALERCAAP